MLTLKTIKFCIAATTILGLLHSSLAHARKLLHKQNMAEPGPEQLCLPDLQEHLGSPCVDLDQLASTNFSAPNRIATMNMPTLPQTTIPIWQSVRQQCGKSSRNKRRLLIYYLFPKLPDMTLNIDNFSLRLDIDNPDGASSFPLALQIGYRSCW